MIKFFKSFSTMYSQSHSFFVKESPSFVGYNTNDGFRLSVKQKLYYPIAYLTFMYLSVSDWFYDYKF